MFEKLVDFFIFFLLGVIACLFFLMHCLNLTFPIEILEPSTRVINIVRGNEKIIYEGLDKNINIEYQTQNKNTPNDLVRIMIFNDKKECIYRRLFKSKNIELQYF
jgi:hypothetical protein